VNVAEGVEGQFVTTNLNALLTALDVKIDDYLRFAEAVVLGRHGRAAAAAAALGEADTDMREPVDARWHRRHARRVGAEAALTDGWGDPVHWLAADLPSSRPSGKIESPRRAAGSSAAREPLCRVGAEMPRPSRRIFAASA
jgi:hypothetical protein